MNLEDLRGSQVGDVALLFDDSTVVSAAFHYHAQIAFAHTVNELIRLSGQSVPMHWDPRVGSVEWWRVIEGTVALLHRVLLRERESGLRPDLADSTDERADVLDKWSAIARWFSNGLHSPPSQLTGLVVELRDFRNSFEHATRASTRTRKHSKLAEAPAAANVADAMEAMAICVAASAYFRYVLPGTDLMPQIVAPSREHVMFEPLDVVAREALFPMYLRLLEARGLGTDISLYNGLGQIRGQALVSTALIVRYEDENSLPDAVQTIDVLSDLGTWVETRETPDPGMFRLPSYGVRSQQ